MRVTRYLWINNLPSRTTEQDIRDVLQSHGKIQSIRIHAEVDGAVVAFADTKSASRAMESVVRINKVNLSLQYCESSGTPCNQSQDSLSNSHDSTKVCNTSAESGDCRFTGNLNELTNNNQDKSKRSSSQACSVHPAATRSSNGLEMNTEHSTTRSTTELRGLQVRQLPLRSSDANLREGLFHEYKKHGKITSVLIRGSGEDRNCIITFKRCEDAERALEVSRGKVFFGTPISVALHQGLDSEDPDLCPPEHAMDEYHPKATKTLFVGNLISNTITQDELRQIFRVYGEIIEIDIKVQVNQPGTSYAFVQYSDIRSVVRALADQDFIRVSGKCVKLGFGKSQPTNVVWLNNLAPSVTEKFLTRQFSRYGHLTHVVLDRKALRALLYFNTVEMAQRALNETRNRALIGRKVQLDYAGYECQVAFMRRFAQHDNFGQVYEDYRERLKQILALWPAYGNVLPIVDRHRMFSDSKSDDSIGLIDNGSPCDRRRMTKYSVNNDHAQSIESTKSRRASVESNPRSSYTSKHRATSRGGHTDERSSSIESSLSPTARVRPRSRDSRKPTHSSSSKDVETSLHLHDVTSRHSRRNISSNYSPYSESSPPISSTGRSLVGVSVKSTRSSLSRSEVKRVSHYLEEADDVSSGPLSPDQECSDTSSPSVTQHTYNIRSPQRLELSKFRDGDVYRKARGSINTTDGKNYKLNRQDTSTRVSSDDRHVSQKPRKMTSSFPPQHYDQCKLRTHPSERSRPSSYQANTVDDNDLSHVDSSNVDDPLTKRYSHSDIVLQRHSRPSKVLDIKADPEKSVDICGGVVCATNVSNDTNSSESTRRTSSERIHKGSCVLKTSEDSFESHDTLTKLELERAKLLRELSLLNNEVVCGNKSRLVSSATKRKREISTDHGTYPFKIKCSDDRQKDTSDCVRQLLSPPTDTDRKQSTSTSYEQSASQEPAAYCSDHLEITKPLMSVTSLRSSSNGCISSSSEPSDIFSLITQRLLSPGCGTSVDNQETTTSTTVSDIKDTSSGILSSICNSTLTPLTVGVACNKLSSMASSMRIVMPPAPASPLTQLSPPEPDDMDNTSTENIFTSPSTLISSDGCSVTQSQGTTLLSTTSNSSIPSVCRDPRLVVHHGQAPSELPPPPPPPPPPEALKLPLWVNTSRLVESELSTDRVSSGSSLARWRSTSSGKPPSEVSSTKHNSTESETKHTVILHDTNCSLDERIRLLDVRLMKSEKARPAVDYSKFRIRRKLESATSTAIGITETMSTTTPPLSSSVTSSIAPFSVTPSSPVGVSGHMFASPLMDRCPVTEPTFVNSPVLPSLPSSVQPTTLPSSPVSVPRLADTSEFVKSMLSASRLSPATPSCDITTTSGSTLTVTNSRRLASRFLSPASSIGQDSLDSSKEVTAVNDWQSNSGTRHLFSSITSRFLPSTVTCMSNTGQAVSVTTRMPMIQPSIVEVSSMHAQRSASFKSILKHDQASLDGSSPTTSSIAPVQSEIANATAPNTIQTTLSQSSVLLQSKKESDRLDNFPPTKPLKSFAKTAVSPAINTVRKTNSKRFMGSTVSSSVKQVLPAKSQKCEVPRPTLDDTVFRSSFDHCFLVKSDRPKKVRTELSSLPSKKCIAESRQSIQPVHMHGADNNVKSNTHTIHRKLSDISMLKNTASDAKPVEKTKGRIPSTKKSKPSLSKDVGKVKHSTESEIGTPKSTKQQVSGYSVTTKKNKKGKLIRRVMSDSENSDWEPSTSTLSKNLADTEPDSLTCPRYESMYDKIKRRASKNTDTKDVHDKSDLIKRSAKTCDRDMKKSTKKLLNPSDADSDTDQCLSDNSSSDDENQQAKRNKRFNKMTAFTEKLSKIGIRRKAKVKRRVIADSSDIKDSSQDFKEGNEFRRTLTESKVKKSGKFDRTTKTGVHPVKSVHRSNQVEKLSNVDKFPSRSKKLLNPSRSSTLNIVSPSLKRHRKTEGDMMSISRSKGIPKREKASVRRVFSTPHSDSLCESDSEPLGVKVKRRHRYERTNVSDRTSKLSVDHSIDSSPSSVSSTHQLSQSCSPDDLDADAAIRHTFGAFTAPPFSSMSSKQTDQTSKATSVSLTPKVDPSLINVSGTVQTSRSTPPTLSMLESGSSVCQSLKLSNKSNPHDAGEWDMFDSIARQSTPKKEPLQLLESLSPPYNPGDAVSNDDQKVSSDFEDLPSLDKHDDEEINKPDGNSILLNETDSLIHNGNNIISLNDDDLPPPVVSVIDLSPQHLSFSDCIRDATSGAVNDIIEEVVYDGLEVHVPGIEQSSNLPSNTQSEAVSSLIKQDDSLENHTHEPIADYPENVTLSKSLIAPDSPHERVSQAYVDASVTSTLPVPIRSSVNPIITPIAVVNSAPTSIHPPDTEQSALVTLSNTVPSFNIKSPKLALIPQCSPQPTSMCNQRHVTLILPATPVALNGSVSHASTPTVFASPKLLLTTSVTDPRETSTIQSVAAVGTCSQQSKSPTASLIAPTNPACSTAIRMPDFVETTSSSVFTIPIDPAICQATNVTAQTPPSSVAFDPSDLKSYVQRVIERVKQEKDEEVSNQREKIRRTKKVLPTPLPIASAAPTVPAPISPAAFISPITPLPVIPGVNVCPKPHITNSQSNTSDQLVNVLRLESVPPSKTILGEIVAPDCNPTTVFTMSSTRRNSDVTEPPKSTIEPSELSATCHYDDTTETTKANIICETLRDTVDEVIDAVLNGQFDEGDYRQRLRKGIFDSCSLRSRSTISSPGVGILDYCTSGNANDESSQQTEVTDQVAVNVGKCDLAFSISTSSPSEPPPSSTFNGSNLINDSQAFKPVHVLTFVAAGTTPAACSQLSNTNVVSPSVSSPCTTPRPSITPKLAHSPVPAAVGGLQCVNGLSSVCEPLTSRLLPTPQCTTSRSITHTEVPAAELTSTGSHLDKFSTINIPLTNYIYSLLTQQQQQKQQITTMTNPLSISSCDTPGITTTTSAGYELHNGSPVIPPFKPFPIPTGITGTVSSSSEAADYYAAAATMAAMAAMVSPSAGLGGSPPPALPLTSSSSTNTGLSCQSNYKEGTGPNLNALESSQQHGQFWLDQTFTVQGYQLAWQGRLALKNEEVHVRMHFLGGTQDLLKSCMGVISDGQKLSATPNPILNTPLLAPIPSVLDPHGLISQPLKIVQRMRLEESQLEGVQRKLRQTSDFCMCITLATAPPHTPVSVAHNVHVHMNRILCDGFIKYMVDKSAAGIINVCHPVNQQNLFVIHIFPPCEFSRHQLELFAPGLAHQLDQQRTPHLLVVITTV